MSEESKPVEDGSPGAGSQNPTCSGGPSSKSAFLRATAGGYILTPDGDDATVVTEVFDFGTVKEEVHQSLLNDGGAWINGHNPMVESMAASLERLEKIVTE